MGSTRQGTTRQRKKLSLKKQSQGKKKENKTMREKGDSGSTRCTTNIVKKTRLSVTDRKKSRFRSRPKLSEGGVVDGHKNRAVEDKI